MITRLVVGHFKIITKLELNLSNLNILTGLNGSGKSSIIQALLLLRQSMGNGFTYFELEGNYVKLGTQGDILNDNARKENIVFALDYIDFKADLFVAELNPMNKNNARIATRDEKPNSEISQKSLFNYNTFRYLDANRITPQDDYPSNFTLSKELGNNGQNTAHCLDLLGGKPLSISSLNILQEGETKSTLLQQVNRWLHFISPSVKVDIHYNSYTNRYTIGYSFVENEGRTRTYKALNSAFGLTYVLPVITAILISEPGDLVIIENPEAHLHPAGQSKIGELFAIAAQAGVQIIIETHSDHILNGIRLAVKRFHQGETHRGISSENVSAYYFRKKNEGNEAEAIPLGMDINGDFDNQPDGFLDEWGNILYQLLD